MINRKGRKERKGYVKTSEHTKITEEELHTGPHPRPLS